MTAKHVLHCHRMLYSCTHMATVVNKGLRLLVTRTSTRPTDVITRCGSQTVCLPSKSDQSCEHRRRHLRHCLTSCCSNPAPTTRARSWLVASQTGRSPLSLHDLHTSLSMHLLLATTTTVPLPLLLTGGITVLEALGSFWKFSLISNLVHICL